MILKLENCLSDFKAWKGQEKGMAAWKKNKAYGRGRKENNGEEIRGREGTLSGRSSHVARSATGKHTRWLQNNLSMTYLLISTSLVSKVSRRNGLLTGISRLVMSFHHMS